MKLTKMIQVRVNETTKYGNFQDALYYDPLTIPEDKDIEIEAQKRIDDWIYLIENPPIIPPPTKEELRKMIDDALAQKLALESYITEKEAELAAKG